MKSRKVCEVNVEMELLLLLGKRNLREIFFRKKTKMPETVVFESEPGKNLGSESDF